MFIASFAAAFSVGRANAATAQANVASLEPTTLSLLESQANAYASTEGPYVNGVWTSSDNTCWACNNGGPATAVATAYVLGGRTNPTLLTMAEDTINTAIATRQLPDGSFLGPPGDTQPAGVATYFYGVEFGTVYQLISPYLDPATRIRWQASLAAAANFLVSSKASTFYINGNINLGFAEFFYLVWKATGDPTFLQDYNNEWTFLLAPPQNSFPGKGLVITKAPTQADGSDGSGYLTETGAGGTGFDPEYTSLQLDVASRLFLLSGDPRALRLANLEVNMLLPLVNSSMRLDTSNGTRHTQSDRYVGLLSSAFSVLSLFGGRADLAADAASEIVAETTDFAAPPLDNPVMHRALGNDIAVQALAESMYSSPPTLAPVSISPLHGPAVAAAGPTRERRTGLRCRRIARTKVSHHRHSKRRNSSCAPRKHRHARHRRKAR